jgi:hypothetical protein
MKVLLPLLVLIAVCILLPLAMTGAQEVPQAVTLALNALSQRVGQTVQLRDLYSYDWNEDVHEDCRPGRRGSLYAYRISLVYNYEEYIYLVPSRTSQVYFCFSSRIPPTPGPSPTPTRTPTPTLTMTPSQTPSPTLTFTPSPTFTPPPTFTPSTTPRFGAVTCPGFMASRLAVGEQGRVLPDGDPNRLRDRPSTTGTQLTTILPGGVFTVLEGPECDPAGRAWWRVEYKDYIGWTVEGQDDEFFTEPIILDNTPIIIPSQTAVLLSTDTLPPSGTPAAAITCPGFMVSRLVIGERGRVTPGDPNNLRDQPATPGALVGRIPAGAEFDVLAGPECDPAGRAWWRVNYNGVIGWTVEGQGDTYYTEPVN